MVRLCSQLSRSAPGHGEHAAVAAVDQADVGRQQALLAHRVAVVRGDAGVHIGRIERLDRDGSG